MADKPQPHQQVQDPAAVSTPVPEQEQGRPQGDQTPQVEKETVSNAPVEKEEVPNGKLVRTVRPFHSEFVMEGQPTITEEGTMVPADKVQDIVAMAERCGVTLEVED